MDAFARRIGAALSPVVLVAGCLVSFDDYPVAGGVSDASTEGGLGGSSGFGGSGPAVGGSSGSGGVSGSGGSAANGGSGPDAGVDGSAATGGGGPSDAATDVIFGSRCSLAGFWTEPTPPKSSGFVIWFKHQDPLACIAFRVICSNGPAVLTPLPDPAPSECPAPNYCWRAQVDNCDPGSASVAFLKDKDLDGTGDCHANFPEAAGIPVGSCDLTVSQ